MKQDIPSVDEWLRQAKADAAAADCGMFLIHNGVVRRSARARVRLGDDSAPRTHNVTRAMRKVRRACMGRSRVLAWLIIRLRATGRPAVEKTLLFCFSHKKYLQY